MALRVNTRAVVAVDAIEHRIARVVLRAEGGRLEGIVEQLLTAGHSAGFVLAAAALTLIDPS